LRRVQLDAVAIAGVGHPEAAEFEPLEAGITGPSLLWRYTKFVQSGRCRH
jgi:hypothetical protein